jgi:hypothetical protein
MTERDVLVVLADVVHLNSCRFETQDDYLKTSNNMRRPA